MRFFFATLSGVLLSLAVGRSQSLNIATWTLELPQTNSTNRAATYDPVLRRAAGVLKPLNADIILLHGVPDRPTARQLIGALRPRVYHNPVYSIFKKNNQSPEIVEPPITILSRKQPATSRSMEWRATGQIDSPGGFSFAVFHLGTNTLFLYTAQFPKAFAGMTPQQEDALPRKRELSARYLVSHLNWLIETTTNVAKFAYLATDLELDDASSTNDPALAVLKESGFTASSGSRTLVASTAVSSTGWPPAGALASAFVRGMDFPGDPESISRKAFFAPVALVEVDLIGPAAPVSVAVSGSTNVVSAAALATDGTSNRLVAWADNRQLAIGAGAAAVLLLALTLVMRSRRREERSLPAAMGLPMSERMALPSQRTAEPLQVVAGPARTRSDGANVNSDDEPEQPHRPSNWPFFHLLRERLVRWLAADRSQLLSSHHAGAEQVLELEERLTKIQNQFEARLKAREQRISDLEAELMAKEKMIADLEQALVQRDPRKSSLP